MLENLSDHVLLVSDGTDWVVFDFDVLQKRSGDSDDDDDDDDD